MSLDYNSDIGYELKPLSVGKGLNRVTLTLKNRGKTDLENVAAELYSADNRAIQINESAQNMGALRQNEAKEIAIRITAYLPTDVYVRLTALKDGKPFRWESPVIYLSVPETNIPSDEQASTG